MPFRGLRRPRAWFAATIATGLAAVSAYVIQIVLGHEFARWIQVVLTAVGSVGTFLAIYLPVRQQRQESLARRQAEGVAHEAALAMRIEMQEYLTPLVNLVADIASDKSTKSRRDKKAQLKQAVVRTAKDGTKAEGRRACFFDYEPGPPRSLTCNNIWIGRARRPTTTFVEGTALGDEMLRMVDDRESRRNEDVTVTPPPGFRGPKDYRTYIATSVAAGDLVFGMLTIDAPEPRSLTDDDEALMRLLAQLLAAGLAANDPSGGRGTAARGVPIPTQPVPPQPSPTPGR